MKQPRIGILLAGDIVSMLIAFAATMIFGFGGSASLETVLIHIQPFAILYVVWLFVFYAFELYDLEYQRHGIQLYRKIAQALLVALLIGVAFFYLVPFYGITPRTNLAINILVFGVFFTMWRIVFSRHISKRFLVTGLIIDPKQRLGELIHLLQKNPQFGLRLQVSTDANTSTEEAFGTVIADTEHMSQPQLHSWYNSPTELRSAIHVYEQYFQKLPVHLLTNEWLADNIDPRDSAIYRIVHRIFDPIFAIIVILVTSPVTIITALFIYLEDKGPIFYTQTRTGLYGKPFKLIKFRSMRMDAEKHGAQWSSGDGDTRTTRIGKIIRKLHIDEIPQMINILRGDIALIGPRAERPEFVSTLEQEIPYYQFRHVIKPGFTGWAQIKFFYARSVMDSYEKFQYDLYYIKNRNLVMDAAILVRTAYIILKH